MTILLATVIVAGGIWIAIQWHNRAQPTRILTERAVCQAVTNAPLQPNNAPSLGHDEHDTEAALPVTPSVKPARPTPSILYPTNLRYVNHRALIETQQAIRGFVETVVSNGVPANSVAFFEHWADALCRDAMTQRAVDPTLSATDRQELGAHIAAGIVLTNIDILAQSQLEPDYLDRLTTLVSALPTLRTQQIDRATALATAHEFGRLTKDRQWESEVHYLAAYKALTREPSLSVAELIEASNPFVALHDPYLTKAILEYVAELPQHAPVTEEESRLINAFVVTAGEEN